MSVCGRIDSYSAWGAFRGYCLRVNAAGSWTLLAGAGSLAAGTISGFDPLLWHALGVRFVGQAVSATVDGVVVWAGTSALFAAGLAAIGSGWHLADFRDFSVVGTS